MEYKLVLEEHMLVLCAETKHCQVACGFDSDSCTYTTTEPDALKHWLCVPITYLNSLWSILLHPVLAFCNYDRVWKLNADWEWKLSPIPGLKSVAKFYSRMNNLSLFCFICHCHCLHCDSGKSFKAMCLCVDRLGVNFSVVNVSKS